MVLDHTTLLKIAEDEGTPSYVYALSSVQEQYHALETALQDIRSRLFYACKANEHRAILELIKKLGCGAEVVSRGEIDNALAAGFAPEDIVFTSSNISRKEFSDIVETGVIINVDSLNQLEWFGQLRPGGEVSVRINKDVGEGHHSHVVTGGALSKFGIHHSKVEDIRVVASRHDLTIVGLHQHIGSHILDEHLFIGAMRILLDFAKQFPDVEYLDFGGGFGVPYEPHEKRFDMTSFGVLVSEEYRRFSGEYGQPLEFRFEPGRYLVASAGVLLVQVTDIKQHSGTTFVGVNSGFNHLVRPMLYSAYHRIENLSNPEGRVEEVTVVGYVCESGDIFARNRQLSQPRIGDILAIFDVGAYGYAMASDYNLRPKPKEIIHT